jgi:hypothetical protein
MIIAKAKTIVTQTAIIAALLLIILTTTSLISNKSAQPVHWSQYEDNRYGFSFSYPSSYKLSKIDSRSVSSTFSDIVSSLVLTNQNPKRGVYITVEQPVINQPLNIVRENFYAGLSTAGSHFDVVGSEPISVNGVSGLRISYLLRDQGLSQNEPVMANAILVNNGRYLITFSVFWRQHDTAASTEANQILTTLRLLQ